MVLVFISQTLLFYHMIQILMMLRSITSIGLIALALTIPSCNTNDRKNKTVNDQSVVTKPSIVKILAPMANESYAAGSTVKIEVKAESDSQDIDSLVFETDMQRITALAGSDLHFSWIAGAVHAGKNRLYFKAYRNGVLLERAQTFVVFKAAKAPKELSYTVVNTYPHDSMAYTQGLYYSDGWLYESTGQYGRSSLRKVRLSTGEIDQSLNLSNEYFGEGMAIAGDKIYQITWKSQKGFIYDKATFRELGHFTYQTEGWGLCFDGKQFILSDGSEQLYFMDKENFSEVSRQEVYDQTGPVKQLNELEFIRGMVFANIYGENYIAIINPSTGFEEAKIDFSKLVLPRYKGDLDHTLNGIAWNPANGHLFITGKEWGKMYEVAVKF